MQYNYTSLMVCLFATHLGFCKFFIHPSIKVEDLWHLSIVPSANSG